LSQKKCVGTTFNERQIMVDAYWKNADPFYIDGDGAESFADFFKRVCYTIDDLKLRKENFIVLFSHEYFILAVRYLLEKGNIEMTKKEMEEFRGYCVLNKIQNAKIIEINNNLLKSIKTIIF
jgi:broad specificity phosphatase PhoE